MISSYDAIFGDEEEQEYDDVQRKESYWDEHQSDYKNKEEE